MMPARLRIVVLEARESDELDPRLRALAPLGLPDAAVLEPQLDVPHQRTPRKQVVILGDVAQVGIHPAHRAAVVLDSAR
jgi:hypothetical protein